MFALIFENITALRDVDSVNLGVGCGIQAQRYSTK